MISTYALKRKYKKFQEEYDLKSEELRRLRNAHTIETDPSQKFKFEKQIEQLDQKRKQLKQELEELEYLFEHPEEIPPFQWDYSKFPINFSSKVDFLTQYFVGRQEAIEKIEQFIQTHQSGYLAIMGEAGIGKSALLAHEVKVYGAVHHFVDDKQNSAKDEVFLRCIVEQLRQKYGFEFDERTPISVSEWNIYFQKWMKEISTEEKLVICVDALDEAQHYGGSDNLLKYLPHELPENVYFILTSRPEFKKEDITFLDSAVFERYELRPLTQADIETYLTQRSPPFLKGGQGGFSEIAIILYQKSEGNPLYLYYLLQEGDGENLTMEQVNQLPQGLMKFYEKQWRERIWTGDKITKEGRKQILILLLLLKEPASEEMLLELTDFDRAELQEYLKPLRRFMRVREHYELFHDSFKNFVAHQFEKTIPVYREKLIEYLWDWRELEGELFKYGLFWLPLHLQKVGYTDKLKDLLLDLNFLEEKTNTYTIGATLRDFDLLLEKDSALRLLEKLILLEIRHFSLEPAQYFLPQLYSRLTEFPSQKRIILASVFENIFKKSRLLPPIWLKRTNHCLGRISGLFFTLHVKSSFTSVPVVFSPDGSLIAFSDEMGTIELWNVKTGTRAKWLIGHHDTVQSMIFSPNGKRLVSYSRDRTVKLWDVTTGSVLRTFVKDSDYMAPVAFSPDGRQIASINSNMQIKLWDVATGQEARLLSENSNEGNSSTSVGFSTIVFSPDSTQLASGEYDNPTIKLWEVKTSKILKTFVGHSKGVHSVAFSPDGRWIVSGSADKTIILWDVEKGVKLRTFKEHTDAVNSVAFFPNSNLIASGSIDETIKLWNIETGTAITTLKDAAHSDSVYSIALSPDGKTLVSADIRGNINLWDLEICLDLDIPQQQSDLTTYGVFSTNGNHFVSGHLDGTVKLWDVETGSELEELAEFSGEIIFIRFSPDGSRLALISYTSHSSKISLLDAETGSELNTLIGIHPNSSLQPTVPGIIKFNLDETSSKSKNNRIELWDVATSKKLEISLNNLHEITCLINFSTHAIAFSPDTKEIVIGCEYDINVWKVITEQDLQKPKKYLGVIKDVIFSPDGTQIAFSCSYDIRVWEIITGKQLQVFEGHDGWVNAVAFSFNGERIASGSVDRTIKLWEVTTGKELNTLIGHKSKVNSIAFSPNDTYIVSGSEDKTVRLWDNETGKLISIFFADAPIICIQFSPDGREIWATDNYYTPQIYRFTIVERDA